MQSFTFLWVLHILGRKPNTDTCAKFRSAFPHCFHRVQSTRGLDAVANGLLSKQLQNYAPVDITEDVDALCILMPLTDKHRHLPPHVPEHSPASELPNSMILASEKHRNVHRGDWGGKVLRTRQRTQSLLYLLMLETDHSLFFSSMNKTYLILKKQFTVSFALFPLCKEEQGGFSCLTISIQIKG